jgi:hypothetical protein
VLLEWDELPKNEFKEEIKSKIILGEITKRIQLKKITDQLKIEKPEKKKEDSVEKMMKLLKTQMKDPKLQAKAKALMAELIN